VPLEAPKLDTRTFEDLVRQARLRIPRYTSEWTDFNDSDPGMTLVQLFAWFTETMLFQLNRVPDRNYIKMLQLLNLELDPAQPAKAHLTFTPQPAALVQPIPAGAQVAAQPADGGEQVIFELETGLDLIRLPLDRVLVFDGTGFSDVSQANQSEDTPFRPFGWVPQINNALYLGFKQTEPPALEPIFPQRLHFRVFRERSQAAGRPQLCTTPMAPPPPPVTLVWEYRRKNHEQLWQPLNVYEDGSARFTSEGYILLEGPKDIVETEEGSIQEKLFWLRCRIAQGSFPAGQAPEIEFIRPNVAPAKNLATVRDEFVGISTGTPDQTFTLRNKPVFRNTLDLRIDVPGEAADDSQSAAGQEANRWEQRADLLASTGQDRHYTLNLNSAEIRFGDGRRGEIPVASAEIVARTYRYGGGSRGNVGKGLINTALTSLTGVAEVTNERPAVGGGDEQSVKEFLEEAPARLRCRNRAVTPEDFAALAKQAGGVINATAIALAHPDHPGVKVPGAVTVVIVPDVDDVPPIPSADQIVSVCEYLNERRLLTSEVYVQGPQLLAIKVEATVRAKPNASFGEVLQGVKQCLDGYLSPLIRETEKDGRVVRRVGWQFGQDLHPTNLYGEILKNVEGVDSIEGLTVYVDNRPHERLDKPVIVPPDGLIYGADHDITVVPAQDR
jgi:predicted phage baseplate assembly protein